MKDIIFDIDGTLIDTEKTGVLSLIQTVKELTGREMPYDEAYRFFGIPSSRVAPMMGYPDARRFELLWEDRFVELSYMMKAFPGVEDMLRRLSGAGCRIGCVTSRNRHEFDKDEQLKPLLPYIDIEICAEDTCLHKPDPEPAREFLRRAGAAPEDTIFVGDTVYDCRCAHGAGIPFLLADWYSRGFRGIPAEFRAVDADEMLGLLLCDSATFPTVGRIRKK